MAQLKITDEQMESIIAGVAAGHRTSKIAEDAGISVYRVKGLLKKKDVADSVARMRLTDTFPAKLDAILSTMSAVATAFENADKRLCVVEEELRKVRTAMRRLQVENKHLRETRRDARRELRELKADLWKARGY